MKKRGICLLTAVCIVLGMVVLNGCGSKQLEAENEVLEDSKVTETSSDGETEESASAEEESHSDDEFYIDKLISEAGVARDNILAVCTEPYEGEGKYSSFIFVGEKDEELEIFDGDLWFVNEEEAVKVPDAAETYYSIDKVLKFNGTDKCFFFADEYYVTQAVSRVYGVRDGKCYETEISRIGSVAAGENNDFTIVVGAYDNTLSSEYDFPLGHTWKPYYFYYDTEKENFAEYYGHQIELDEIVNKYGIDIGAEIQAIGGTCLAAYWRDNGILTVNYSIREDYSGGMYDITYDQANYNVNLKEYIDAWGTGEHSFKGSSFGGEYQAAICPGLMYEKNISDDELYECFINGDIMDSHGDFFEYKSLVETKDASLECRKLDIDEDGTEELIPVLYGSYTYCLYTIRDGIIARIGMEDCICGSEGGYFNDKHQYVGTDCTHAGRNQYIISEFDPVQGMKVVGYFAKWWQDEDNPDDAEYVKSDSENFWELEWDDYTRITEEEYNELLSEYTKELAY